MPGNLVKFAGNDTGRFRIDKEWEKNYNQKNSSQKYPYTTVARANL